MAPSVNSFHPENILELVKSLRSDAATASFCFGTADRPLSGKQCFIYVVRFPTGDTWAVRVPVHISHLPPEVIASFVEDEVSILKRLEASGFRWSPRLLAYDSQSSNPIGFPYMVLSWIDGTQLEWSDTVPPLRESRNKILQQIADIIFELADCTTELCTQLCHCPLYRSPSLHGL